MNQRYYLCDARIMENHTNADYDVYVITLEFLKERYGPCEFIEVLTNNYEKVIPKHSSRRIEDLLNKCVYSFLFTEKTHTGKDRLIAHVVIVRLETDLGWLRHLADNPANSLD